MKYNQYIKLQATHQLKEKRLRFGESQKQFTKEINRLLDENHQISLWSYGRLERREASAKIKLANIIAKVLDEPRDSIFLPANNQGGSLNV